jgi:adenine-specific DNA glycosylase
MRTLSAKGGIKRSQEAQVILPMHRSIAKVNKSKNPTMVDFSALICTMPRPSKIGRLIARIIKLF